MTTFKEQLEKIAKAYNDFSLDPDDALLLDDTYSKEEIFSFGMAFTSAYRAMGQDERALFYALRFALKKLYVFHRDKFGEAVEPYNFPQRPSAEKAQQDLEPVFQGSL